MKNVEEFFEKIISVKWGVDKKSVDIIDQTLLPCNIKRIQLVTKEEIWEAIKKLRVRGAPAIGVCAAYGMALLASKMSEDSFDAFYNEFKVDKDYLASSRPTAVNLFWALNRMEKIVLDNKGKKVNDIKKLLLIEAEKIRDEDVQISRNIGEIGFKLLKELKKTNKEIGIMIHCNAGTLAIAKHYGVPFYVCAPSSTIDIKTKTGDDIPIEMRDKMEISKMWYKESMTAEGVDIFNPAFDVTDYNLITGIITEKGICKAPFDKAFEVAGIN